MRNAILLCAVLVGCGGESASQGPVEVVSLGDDAPAPEQHGQPPVGSAPPPMLDGDETPDAEPTPDPEVEPVRLLVDLPLRGSRVDGGTVHVRGEVLGGSAPHVTVAGWTVQPARDGSFAIHVPVERGLNILATEVVDGQRVVEDRRAVLAGPFEDAETPVEDAMHVEVGTDALETASGLLSDYLSELDVWSLVDGQLPEGVEIESLSYGRINLRVVPRDGYLEVYLAVDRLRASVAGTVTRLGVSATFRGTAEADPAEVVARVEVSPAADGTLDLDVLGAEVGLRNFDYDIRYVPGFLEDWFAGLVRGQLEGIVERAMRDFAVPALFDDEALTRTVEVLGNPFTVGLGVRDIDITHDGIAVSLDAVADAPEVVREGAALAALKRRPTMDADGDVDLAVSADLLNRVAHAAWAGGMLDFALDDSVDLPIPVTPALLAPMLGEAATDLDFSAPLFIRVAPLLPPVATIERGERPLVIRIGDMLLELSTPEGPLVTVAVQIEARTALTVTTGEQIGIDPDLEVTVHADVAETPRGPVEDIRLERFIEELAALIPGIIAQQTLAFGADVIPVPVSLVRASVEADELAAFAHVRAAVE